MKQLLLLIAITFSMAAQAEWILQGEGSHLGFATVKNDLIAENHSFTQLNGTVSDEGRVEITIPLSSVETMIPIRNERMRSMLFDVATYPLGTVNADIDLAAYTSLAVGDYKINRVTFTVNLHGTALEKTVAVKVLRSGSNSFDVSSLNPIVIHASQFSLAEGVESLRKVAGLQSIDLMVPVSFDLRFAGSVEG